MSQRQKDLTCVPRIAIILELTQQQNVDISIYELWFSCYPGSIAKSMPFLC